jgi:hypothetical protein
VTNDTPRGPYKSHTAGMSAREAAAWFAREAIGRGCASTPETAYLNGGTLPSCDSDRVREKKVRVREWYRQGSFPGGQGRIK